MMQPHSRLHVARVGLKMVGGKRGRWPSPAASTTRKGLPSSTIDAPHRHRRQAEAWLTRDQMRYDVQSTDRQGKKKGGRGK